MRNAALLFVAAGWACGAPSVDSSTPTTATGTTSTGSTTTTTPVDCGPEDYTDTYPQFCGSVPKNLIFISIDTFRRDHFGYQGDMDTTPFLDGLAEEGAVMLDHAQCSDWTFASTTCTLMGRTNVEADFIPKLGGTSPIPNTHDFLPLWLREAQGTYSVLGSNNAWLSDIWGNGKDYDRVIYPAGSRFTEVATNVIAQYELALEVGLTDADKPFFLHMHGLEPHAPYTPLEEFVPDLATLDPIEWDLTKQSSHYEALSAFPAMTPEEQDLLEQHLRIRYRGEIQTLDKRISDVFTDLEYRGMLDDTLVVFWTDHGEAFWERGHQTHAYTLYPEENNAVLFFWSKNIVKGDWAGPTSGIDVVPTLLELYGIEMPETVTGTPIGQAAEDRARHLFVSARLGEISGIRKDGWRMQYQWASGVVQLTNTDADPLELEDLYNPEDPLSQPIVGELWPLMEPQVDRAAAALGLSPIKPPELEAL